MRALALEYDKEDVGDTIPMYTIPAPTGLHISWKVRGPATETVCDAY